VNIEDDIRVVVIVPFDEPVNQGTNGIRGDGRSKTLDQAFDVERKPI
ncbi:hypothetical protein A2U01_0099773, partial [Trifolium medium]|nr:hypothetical protein [Trifolium medium]